MEEIMNRNLQDYNTLSQLVWMSCGNWCQMLIQESSQSAQITPEIRNGVQSWG